MNMKKIVLLISLLFCLNLQNAWSQTEVRGIETRRVVYNGPEYSTWPDTYHNEYYGWEFYNANSIPVSLDIELWCSSSNTIVKSQSIIIKSGEKYIFKREEHLCVRVYRNAADINTLDISQYYVKYRAYKLE